MCNTGIKPEELVECGIYGSRPLRPDVGGIVQREDGSIYQVLREHYGEGDIFKSWRRFYLGALDEVCYVPEGSDSGWTIMRISERTVSASANRTTGVRIS
mgnify:CR=1 FL=1